MLAPDKEGADTSQRYAGGIDPEIEQFGGCLDLETNSTGNDFQQWRAAFIGRRHRLAPGVARAVVALAFSEVSP
jgi:hypothetical protein